MKCEVTFKLVVIIVPFMFVNDANSVDNISITSNVAITASAMTLCCDASCYYATNMKLNKVGNWSLFHERNLAASLVPVQKVLLPCECQREPSLLVNFNSFSQILRTTINVPKGRSANIKDIILRFYGSNSTSPLSYRLRAIKLLLADPSFDYSKPTVIYAHGYVELTTDKSVQTVVRAYHQNGQYNVLILDWANLAFGNYITVALDIPRIGKVTGAALYRLIKRGLPVTNIHLVGHSLGAHVMAYAARHLAGKALRIPRLTGLDPAYPGYYPSFFGQPISKSDALFVDVIHTDGGGYGTPSRTGHVDFWPNEGGAKQPGCLTATVLLTVEDFCSHWRSWEYWAESVVGGDFLARRCDSYDSFLRRRCNDSSTVYMGLRATPNLRGDYYLRTATKEPYALGIAGAD